MKSHRLFAAALLFLPLSLLHAEEVTIAQPAVLKAERSAVALKAGTVVELISRDGDSVTIRYKDLTGKIPASKLEEPKAAAAKPKEDKAEPPARVPQTGYGKAVQKAKDSAKSHDKNVVRPTDEIIP